MNYRTLKDYYDSVVYLVAVNGLTSELHRIRFSPKSPTVGYLRSEPLITFADGATLRFHEELQLENRQVQRLGYAFHYERQGYFFRYDKDLKRAKPYCHHETHLHANQENIRFITHETSFEEVFTFIMKCFYS